MYIYINTRTNSFIYMLHTHSYTSWIIPAYRCSKGAEKLCIMRVVRRRCEGVKEGEKQGLVAPTL